MKYFLLLILVFAFTECQTSSVSPENTENTLTGRWMWLQSSGGFAGTTNTPASTKQTIEIEFTTNFHQRLFLNGELKSDFTYHIIQDTSIYTGKVVQLIEYDQGSSRKSYSFANGELILADECYDCFVSTYRRKRSGKD